MEDPKKNVGSLADGPQTLMHELKNILCINDSWEINILEFPKNIMNSRISQNDCESWEILAFVDGAPMEHLGFQL